MKVGVVTVRSSSGEIGGAERFYDALVAAFRSIGHEATELCVEASEATFEDILDNYLACYDLDVSSYDIVVSTKAPTWMVRHPRHVSYLVHTIRVFYDMFDGVFPHATRDHLQQRDLIHRMDSLALSRDNCKRVFSIGSEVSKRLSRWNGIDADVLHPPLWSDTFRRGPQGDYLFLPGRLHPWKRVDLVIRAMSHVKAPLRLLISGTGEAESHLKDLASNDPRIEFLGRVEDSRLVELYSNAFAVPFVPEREDYGYVTLEAFASGKPVITCLDSGEAAAIVRHGESGFVCPPSPERLGEHIEKLWASRRLASDMGAAGNRWVQSLSWSNIAIKLVQAAEG